MDVLFHILIGIGLATACGFRVFVPLWVLSFATLVGKIELVEGFQWIGTTPAFIVFTVAVVIEIMIYYIPFVDNLLDLLSTPVAVVAGAVVMSSYIHDIDLMLKYTLLLIVSSSFVLIAKGIMSSVRSVSSTVTAGVGNGIVSTTEWIMSLVLSILAIIFPLLFPLFLLIIFVAIWKFRKKKAV